MATETTLPDNIREALAIANAASVGEQPAILANLALANQIFNNTLFQQNLIRQQQANSQILLTLVAKGAALINKSLEAGAKPDELKPLLDFLRNAIEQSNKSDQRLVDSLTSSLEQARQTAEALAAGNRSGAQTGPTTQS